MSKNKGARITITLECPCRSLNNEHKYKRKKGIFRYTSTKNRKNTPRRIELMKFCPNCNEHKQFKEIK
uniref:Large ribosomal subunit protein bL33c n=1 Tax=Gracilariopsis heteroclada TaxID=172978 RepID=A0A344V653_9FLOR|nr:ribosomal protein L33 [Gracilariopsis heteroclada]AXE43440.1 ribosomal protein L33 [Gracilariopsis heteroclada]